MNIEETLQILKKDSIRYLRLQFIDILGIPKNVEVPESQFQKALEGKIMFDGSSIYGFSRIEESDMLLQPDLETLTIFPWNEAGGKTARVICDVLTTDGKPFDGCPRTALKRNIRAAAEKGFEMLVGPEPEFFLFETDEHGTPILNVHDNAGYFDLAPLDRGEFVRKEIVLLLQKMGFEIEASHHEVAPGQHEIDFKYDNALKTADNITTFTFIVRKVAKHYGLHATFLPKPIFGINGSGMHLHQSLFKEGVNAFNDPEGEHGLSSTALHYIAGILAHAKALAAVTNPLVNSYKRLLPGYEAPVNIAWSLKNRSPLIRVPDKRGEETRIEFRAPDPCANPYLAIAACLAAGMDGIKKKADPPPLVNGNIFDMSSSVKENLHIESLPKNIFEAVIQLKHDTVISKSLGEHITEAFVRAKITEWEEYSSRVHGWEMEKYISMY